MIEHVCFEESVFFLERHVFRRTLCENIVMEDIERKRFCKIFVFIGEGVSRNEIHHFHPFFLHIIRIPGNAIKSIGCISEKSTTEIVDIDNMSKLMNEDFYSFGIGRYLRGENEFISNHLSAWFPTFGVDEEIKRGNFRLKVSRMELCF